MSTLGTQEPYSENCNPKLTIKAVPLIINYSTTAHLRNQPIVSLAPHTDAYGTIYRILSHYFWLMHGILYRTTPKRKCQYPIATSRLLCAVAFDKRQVNTAEKQFLNPDLL